MESMNAFLTAGHSDPNIMLILFKEPIIFLERKLSDK
jgi:hypothetical protein